MLSAMRRALLGAMLFSGCIKGAMEERSEAPPARTEAAWAGDEASMDAVLASLDEVEAAYFEDCRHRFQLEADEGDGEDNMVDECSWLAFDQNCAPDPGGCWEAGQTCQTGCASTCVSCDDTCGGGCETCKAKCGETDGECLAACASARAECRERCLVDKKTCLGKTCPDTERACYEAHERLVQQKCPKCDEIRACVEEQLEAEESPVDVCGRKFRGQPEECFEWCGLY